MKGLLLKAIAAVVLGLLKWLSNRKDLEENVRLEIYSESQDAAIRALRYKLDASDPSRLRVREGADQVRLSGRDPDPRSGPPYRSL